MLGTRFELIGLFLMDKTGRTGVFGLRFEFCESLLVDEVGRIGGKGGMSYCD